MRPFENLSTGMFEDREYRKITQVDYILTFSFQGCNFAFVVLDHIFYNMNGWEMKGNILWIVNHSSQLQEKIYII